MWLQAKSKIFIIILSFTFASVVMLVSIEIFARIGVFPNERFAVDRQIKELVYEKRVLLVGDSFSIEYEGSFAFLLRDFFEDRQISLLNLAVAGDAPQNYYQKIALYTPVVRPQFIILNYYVGNDLTDTLKTAQAQKSWYRIFEKLLEFSYAAQYFKEQINSLYMQRRLPQMFPSLPPLPTPQGQPILNPSLYLYAQKYPQALEQNLLVTSTLAKDAWQKNRVYLEQIYKISQANSAKLVIIISPNTLQINDKHVNFYRHIGFDVSDQLLDSTAPQDLLNEFCQEKNAVCIDLLPTFRQKASPLLYLENDDHWDAAGHSLGFETSKVILKQIINTYEK